MSDSIFRDIALERLSTPEQLDLAMRVTSPAAWLALTALAVVIAALGAWSFIGTVPERVSAKGILINPGGVVDVVSSTRGSIAQLLVRSGQWVEAGQKIAQVAQPDVENALLVANAELAEAQSEYKRLLELQQRDVELHKSYLAQKRVELDLRTSSVEARLHWLSERETIEAGLQAQGLIERQRAINTKIEINDAKDEQQRILNDAKQLDADDSAFAIAKDKERTEQEDKVATLTRTVATLKDKLQRNSNLLSEYSGYVVELKVNIGDVVDVGRALFSMQPQAHRVADRDSRDSRIGNLVAKLYVRAEDGKKIRVGMPAQISPSTVQQEEYGFIEGTVTEVASVPSTEEGIMRVLANRQLVQELTEGGTRFEVTVALARDPKSNDGYRWSSSAGPDVPINPGTISTGNVTLRNIHIISLAFPSFERVFDGN